ncbi:hypothetical protein C7212DRAFT_338645 [Tuber magnatum]|uniref:Secreted protein n=1 Tax=Tuber magnatum TaxID=42249 RepID=A0A317SGU6_9PEZI|nr:hypothetical protein C7212DRAFT_338645 [Tuber magnatum]
MKHDRVSFFSSFIHSFFFFIFHCPFPSPVLSQVASCLSPCLITGIGVVCSRPSRASPPPPHQLLQSLLVLTT